MKKVSVLMNEKKTIVKVCHAFRDTFFLIFTNMYIMKSNQLIWSKGGKGGVMVLGNFQCWGSY